MQKKKKKTQDHELLLMQVNSLCTRFAVLFMPVTLLLTFEGKLLYQSGILFAGGEAYYCSMEYKQWKGGLLH